MARRKWEAAFLKAIELGADVIVACQLADVTRQVVYDLRGAETVDGDRFRQAWIAAEERFDDSERKRVARRLADTT